MTIKDIRTEFENQPKEFYGGNNLQRDGEGYDSSYVNMKWEVYQSVVQALDSKIGILRELVQEEYDYNVDNDPDWHERARMVLE